VREGEKLARSYRLPPALIDFILQHHGTTPVLYFYNKALEAVDCDKSLVDIDTFRYPGPCPQSREAAILMLADASESTVRAKRPRSRQEIAEIIGSIIEARMVEGQLDNSQLTIKDLKIIQEVFVSTLQGVFHPRIVYPTIAEHALSASSTANPPTPAISSGEAR
jgi:cyclic-di-AMP phosphodiesterase PgpH